jgi:hypothetical protein
MQDIFPDNAKPAYYQGRFERVNRATPIFTNSSSSTPSEFDAMLKFEGMPNTTIRKIKIAFGNAAHEDIHLPVRGGASVRRSGRAAPEGPAFGMLESR